MAEITSAEGIIKKLKEFDRYVTQSFEVLKTLKGMKEDGQKLSASISDKKKQLERYELELLDLQKKTESVSKDADTILAPMLKEKAELTKLNKKLTEGIAQLGATIQVKIEEGLVRLSESQNEFQEKVREYIRSFRKETDSQTTDFLNKQNALVSNLAQQIDSYQRLTESLRISADAQSNQIRELKEQNAKEKLANEEQSQRLEKQIIELKTEVGELSTRLSNMKFKRILGM